MRSLRRPFLLIIPLVLIVLLVIGYIALRPAVLSTTPADGASSLPAFQVVSIEFSRPMDIDSVEDALSVEPAVAYQAEWEENTLWLTPSEGWPAGTPIHISLGGSTRSTLNLPLVSGLDWQFEIAVTELAYLWPADGGSDLYLLSPETGQTRQLTTSANLLDFHASADGQTIYFSASNAQKGSDLYAVSRAGGVAALLLECGPVDCEDVHVSPDGDQLAYLRTAGNAAEVWVFTLTDLSLAQISAEGHETRFPRWAPTGELTYYDVTEGAYLIHDLQKDSVVSFRNETGELGSWSPNGTDFVAPELYVETTNTLRGPSGEEENQTVDPSELTRVQVLTSHLLAFNPISGAVQDLSLADVLEDTAPSFSPDGRWIAFARRYLDEARFTTGRQLWLMRPDGSDLRALTDDPEYKYTDFAWAPDGRTLAAERFNATVFTDPIEIWLFELPSGQGIRLVIGGYAPQWLP